MTKVYHEDVSVFAQSPSASPLDTSSALDVTPQSKKTGSVPVLSNYSTSNSLLSSFLTHQTTNPTSSSSTNLYSLVSSSNVSSSTSPQHSKQLKKLLSDYKRLTSELSKFNSKSGIQKTNHLRLTLLNFLRLQTDDIYRQVPRPYCQKAAMSGLKILIKWWQAILAALLDLKKPLPGSQKLVYYECVSRIMTRHEWSFINDVSSNSEATECLDEPKQHQHQHDTNMFIVLLTKTLDYSLTQLNNKNSTLLSFSAFVGKVFALCFFHLKDVSNALLFLLNVRISSVLTNYEHYFKDELNYLKLQMLCNEHSRYPVLVRPFCRLEKLTYGMKLRPHATKLDFSTCLDKKPAKPMPPHVAHRTAPPRKFNFNAVEPPRAPVKGIADPQGPWVKKWSSFNSDVFVSFLRHYLTLNSDYVASSEADDKGFSSLKVDIDNGLNALVVSPGSNIIWSHVYDILVWTIKSCASKTKKNHAPRPSNASATGPLNMNNMTLSFFNMTSSSDARKSTPLHSVSKIFLVVRDFLYNPRSLSERLAAKAVVTNFDNLLVRYAQDVSAYDYLKAGYLLDLTQEFVTQVCSCEYVSGDGCVENSPDRVRSHHFGKAINWTFWLTAVQNMLLTENVNSQLKALAFLFNVWDYIPDDNDCLACKNNVQDNLSNKWFKNQNYSIKYNFASWMVSPKNWLQFFCHWQPLVRSYYLRLIVWRVLATSTSSPDLDLNSYQSGIYFNVSHSKLYFNASKEHSKLSSDAYVNKEKLKKIVTDRLNWSYDKIIKISQFSSMGYYMMPDMNGSCPVINRKFSITPINFKTANENLFIDPNIAYINAGSSSSSGSNSPTDDNKKTGLTDLVNGLVLTQSQVRKISPFEIFDDAVYSTTAYSTINDDDDNPLTSSTTVVGNDTIDSLTTTAPIPPNTKPRTLLNKSPSASNVNNGGKLLGFAMKLFKKSKSSSSFDCELLENKETDESKANESKTELKPELKTEPAVVRRATLGKSHSSKSLVDCKKLNTGALSDFINNSTMKSSSSATNLRKLTFASGIKSIQSFTSVSSAKTASERSSLFSTSLSEEPNYLDDEDSLILSHKPSLRSVKNIQSKKRTATLSSTSLKSMSSSVNTKQAGLESIPMPPEFQKKTPDIQRQMFKFSLIWHDESLNYQLFIINNSSFTKFYNPSSYTNFNSHNKFPHYPTLPFSQSVGIGYIPTDEEYTHTTELDPVYSDQDTLDDDVLEVCDKVEDFKPCEDSKNFEDLTKPCEDVKHSEDKTRRLSVSTYATCQSHASPQIGMVSPLVEGTAFKDLTLKSESNKTSPNKPVSNRLSPNKQSKAKKSKQLQKLQREKRVAFHTLKKWGGVGKSLNEWNDVVKEYEDFIRSRKIAIENERLINMHSANEDDFYAGYNDLNLIPLLLAEAPAPKINAA